MDGSAMVTKSQMNNLKARAKSGDTRAGIMIGVIREMKLAGMNCTQTQLTTMEGDLEQLFAEAIYKYDRGDRSFENMLFISVRQKIMDGATLADFLQPV